MLFVPILNAAGSFLGRSIFMQRMGLHADLRHFPTSLSVMELNHDSIAWPVSMAATRLTLYSCKSRETASQRMGVSIGSGPRFVFVVRHVSLSGTIQLQEGDVFLKIH